MALWQVPMPQTKMEDGATIKVYGLYRIPGINLTDE